MTDTQIKAAEAAKSFKGAQDTPVMKHVDAYGTFVEESDPRARQQVNPDTAEGKALIERLQKAPKPADYKGTTPEVIGDPVTTDPPSDANIITSKIEDAPKPLK